MLKTEQAESLELEQDLLYGQLKPFQKERGVPFIRESGYRCLLAHDMRLGKTVQALMACKLDWERVAPILIVVKARTRHNWAGEVLYWLGKAKDKNKKWGRHYEVEHDYSKMPQILEPKSIPLPGFGIYICSMDSIGKVTQKLIKAKIKINTVIIDESHNFKNMQAKRTQDLHNYIQNEEITQIICLSGTPISNNALEYYPTLKLLRPEFFPSFASFVRNYILLERPGKGGLHPWRAEAFFDKTKHFIQRITKKEVLLEQPPFTRIPEICEVTDPAFVKVYKQGQKELQDFIEAAGGKRDDTFNLMVILTRLREMCGIAKTGFVVDAVEEYFENETDVPKLLIGVHHHSVGNALKVALKKYGAEYLIGGINDFKQSELEYKFKNDPNCKILIASTLAAGEGLDFQFVHTVFQTERQWNVYKEKQFEDRINGMDQKYPMTAVYFMVANSIDEWFHALITKKMQWTESALDPEFFKTNDISSEASINLWDLADMVVQQKIG